MRKLLSFIVVAILSINLLPAQGVTSGYAYRIRPVTALPASCTAANGEVASLTTGGFTTLYHCVANNAWNVSGLNRLGQFVISQGTITANAPAILHTATWNNAAVTFTGFDSDTTITASSGTGFLVNMRVGGVPMFLVNQSGSVLISNYFAWTARSGMRSAADSRINFVDNALATFDRLTLGPEVVTHPAIMVAPTVGGQTQGIRIVRGDGTNQVFASLGAAVDGAMIYCADCTIATPCAGGGTGAIAKRLNGVWVCN